MPDFQIDLSSRFRSAFGITSSFASDVVANNQSTSNSYSDADFFVPKGTKTTGTNYLAELYDGERVYDLLSLSSANNSLNLEMIVMLSLSRSKRVVTTVINQDQEGGLPSGEVVESFGWLPWEISIKGLLVNMETKAYPLAQLKQLNRMADVHDTLAVESEFLNEMKIYSTYITKFSLVRENQFPDTQAFTLNMKSHATIEALILS